MLLEHCLDLGRIDVHPARDDHVGLAVADVDVTLIVAVSDVPHRVEIAAPGRVVAVLLLVLLVEDNRRSHVELARMTGPGARHLAARIVEQADLDAGRRLAARSWLAPLVLRLPDAGAPGPGRTLPR